jgi:hypothetical protein
MLGRLVKVKKKRMKYRLSSRGLILSNKNLIECSRSRGRGLKPINPEYEAPILTSLPRHFSRSMV